MNNQIGASCCHVISAPDSSPQRYQPEESGHISNMIPDDGDNRAPCRIPVAAPNEVGARRDDIRGGPWRLRAIFRQVQGKDLVHVVLIPDEIGASYLTK